MKIKKVSLLIALSALLLSGCGNKSYNSGGAMAADSVAMNTSSFKGMTQGVSVSSVAQSSYESGATADYAAVEEVIYDDVVEYEVETPATPQREETNIKETTNQRKLIRTVNLSMQTKQFDKFVDTLGEVIDNFDGYIESSDIDGIDYYNTYCHRNANFTIRIPKEKLDSFLSSVNDLGVTSYKSENVEDVTLNYYDVEAQKDALEVEQERLMDILEKSETIDQIIMLEQRLSDVRYQLNSLGSTLRLLDNKVDYSTVYLRVSEVEVEIITTEEKTIFDTIKENWEENIIDIKDFFEELIVNMVSNIGTIIFEIIAVILIIVIVKKIKKHKRKKKEKKMLENKDE